MGAWPAGRQPGGVPIHVVIGANGYPVQIQVNGKAMGKATTTVIHYSRYNDPTLRIDAP